MRKWDFSFHSGGKDWDACPLNAQVLKQYNISFPARSFTVLVRLFISLSNQYSL